jgi:uncharacterized protein involved in tolerance to divalent cations
VSTKTYDPNPLVTTLKHVIINGKIAHEVNFGKVRGVAKYRVYYKTSGGSWTRIGDTTGSKVYNQNIKGNSVYYYTVRGISNDGTSFITGFQNSGNKSLNSYETPAVANIYNRDGSQEIVIHKVSGVSKYRVYVRSGNDWKRVGETTGASVKNTSVKNNTNYNYTVRGIDNKGDFFTSFSATGWTSKYYQKPSMEHVTNKEGNKQYVSWSKVSGITLYRLERAVGNGSYQFYSNINCSNGNYGYYVGNLKSGVKYTYRVTCLDSSYHAVSVPSGGMYNTYKVPEAQKPGITKSAPSIIKVENASGAKQYVQWTCVSGVTKYRL